MKIVVKEKRDKLLSLILTVYNKEKFINRCLKSIINLKKIKILKNNFEVIVVNDKSSDKSLKIINKWKKKNQNYIKLINNKKNIGVSEARNLGIKKSKGKYLQFIDGDDSLITKNFKFLDKYLKTNIDLFIFYNTIETNNYLSKPKIKTLKKNKTLCNSVLNADSTNKWNVWRFIFKKEFLINKKIFFKNKLFQNEDWVFLAEVLSNNPKFFLINKCIYNYNNKVDNSLTKQKTSKKTFKNALYTYLYLKKNLKNSGTVKKIIKLMICDIKKIIFIDLFNLRNEKIEYFKKKYPFLKIIIIQYLKFNKKILMSNKKILIFCAGRLGRTLIHNIPIYRFGKKIIIDNNKGYKNIKYNNFIIKNFYYYKKNIKILKNYICIICNLNNAVTNNIKEKLMNNNIKNCDIINVNYNFK